MKIKRGKKGADVRYWVAAIWGAMAIAEGLWRRLGYESHSEMVVTSGCEGKHSTGSKHYLGMAGDIRTRDPQGAWVLQDHERNEFVTELRARLGDEFDVVVSEPYMNVHIELDPKAPLR